MGSWKRRHNRDLDRLLSFGAGLLSFWLLLHILLVAAAVASFSVLVRAPLILGRAMGPFEHRDDGGAEDEAFVGLYYTV